VNASDSNVDANSGESGVNGSCANSVGVSVADDPVSDASGTLVSEVEASTVDAGRTNDDVASIILSPHWLQKTLLAGFSAKQCGHFINVQPFPMFEAY
jgi:hypothetical protein